MKRRDVIRLFGRGVPVLAVQPLQSLINVPSDQPGPTPPSPSRGVDSMPSIDVRSVRTSTDPPHDWIPTFNRAIAALEPHGGGRVVVPQGTYSVAPNPTMWIMVPSNVEVVGCGPLSELRVRDDAGGYRTIFGGPTETSRVERVAIRDLRINQNPVANTTGSIGFNISQVQNAIRFGNFMGVTVERCFFDPCCGVNTVILSGRDCEHADVLDNFFRFQQLPNQPVYDNSAIYLHCANHRVVGNTLVAGISENARSAIETHAGPAIVSGNLSDGYGSLCNVVSASPSAESPLASNIVVSGNSGSQLSHGIRLWSITEHWLSNVVISNNTLSIAQADHRDATSSGISLVPSSGGGLDGSYENIAIVNNTITYQDENRSVDAMDQPVTSSQTYGIGLAPRGNVTQVQVTGNIISRAPAQGISLGRSGASTILGVRISDNLLLDSGQNAGMDENFRTALRLAGNLGDVFVEDNVVIDSGLQRLRGRRAIWAQPAISKNVIVRNNSLRARSGNFVASTIARNMVQDDFGEANLQIPLLESGDTADLSVPCLGASIGDVAMASPLSAPPVGLIWNTYVDAVNSVTVRIMNASNRTIEPDNRPWRVAIRQRQE